MDSAFSESPLRPGSRLDRYELLCPLAQGGMALVWLARFGGKLAGFEKLVVVKTILPQYAQDPRFQRMFLDEARIAARIEHPNVTRILDVGEERGTYYIVMEWVDGDSLSKLMRAADEARHPIPTSVALRVCADVCAGLEAAHELCDPNGEHLAVVHRDVSPQNVLIGPGGEAKLIDFGVAKARDRMAQDTTAGQLKGKLRYMSPEQAKGGHLDGRADLWSVGALLYEMLSGQPPYDGPHELAILHRLVSGERPEPMPPSIPAPVRAVVDRAMRYDATERFGSAREMQVALENTLAQIGETGSHAAVSQLAETLLAGRTMQRRRTVEAALIAAQKRSQMSTRNNTNDGVVYEAYPVPETAPEPSHASNATLGSAALAGPPSADEESERRRILGMIVVAASLMIVLSGIAIGLVVKRSASEDAEARTTTGEPPRAAGGQPQPATSIGALPVAGQPTVQPAALTGAATTAAPVQTGTPISTGVPISPATGAATAPVDPSPVAPPPVAPPPVAPPPVAPPPVAPPPVAPPPVTPATGKVQPPTPPPTTPPATVKPPAPPTTPTTKPSGSGKRRDYGFGN